VDFLRHVMLTAMVAVLVGCTQFPTEKASVSDLRPQISFTFQDGSISDARVLVDGLDVGRAGDFRDGKAALRVLPGNHVVSVVLGGRALIEQRVYLNDGVSRAFMVQ